MFYMACELLTRPDLNKKPACVGRGMILTSNYVARRYGVRSAMAGFIGDKLVEELSKGRERLIHVPSNFALYKEKSRIVTEVIREYDPHRMKSYSLDEVYLDIGPYLAFYIQHRDYTHEQIRDMLLLDGNADENGNKINDHTSSDVVMGFLQSQSPLVCLTAVDQVVLRLRRHVQKATGGLTCSAGVARTHTTAKIASDKNKPNGQLVIDPGNTLHFVRELPVRKIPGIGRVTEKLLQNVCNIQTGMDLYQKRGLVNFLFQPATAKFLLKASVGCSGEGSTSTFGVEIEEASSSASSSEHQKGISRERSFQPESDWAQLNIRLEEISRMLAKDMMTKSMVGHTITVKVKLDTFDVLSRSQSQKRGVYVQNPEELATIAGALFATIRAAYQCKESKNSRSKFSVRLLGIRCSNLIEESSFYGKTQVGTIDKFLAASCKTVDFTPDTNPNNRAVTDTKLAVRAACTPNESKPQTTNGQRHDDDNNGDDEEGNENNNDATTNENKCVVHCPLCHRSFLARDNDRLNAHIDTCLNGIYGGSMVRQVVREEESRLQDRDYLAVEQGAVSPRERRQRLTDFWNYNF
jgi:DNA polymerase kappa